MKNDKKDIWKKGTGQEDIIQDSSEEVNPQENTEIEKPARLKALREKGKRLVVCAAVVGVAVLLLFAYVYSLLNNRNLTVIAVASDVTFVEKQRQDEAYYVTFQVEDNNLIPDSMNKKGVTVQVSSETYNAIVLNVKYGFANILFEVPQSVARKAGYQEELANVQVLWQEDILKQYVYVRSLVWSTSD